MNKTNFSRFETASALSCPICHEPLLLVEHSLKCSKRHSFDISKFGYVNLAPHIKPSKDYDKDSFKHRQVILDGGFYNHILEEIKTILQETRTIQRILDIGCGEGFYARKLQEEFSKDIYAFDLSKDSIQLAAKSDQSKEIKWMVADLAKLPIKEQSMDLLLDIFSPANYHEFQRVLKPSGYLLKVIPNADHLKEIREKVEEQLLHKNYSNQKITDLFEQHFHLMKAVETRATYPLNAKEKEALLTMTPLLFNVHQTNIDWSDLTHITISATILIGHKK